MLKLPFDVKLQFAWIGATLVASTSEILESAPDPEWFGAVHNNVPLTDVVTVILSVASSGNAITPVSLVSEVRALERQWSKSFNSEFIRLAIEANNEMGGIISEYSALIKERWLAGKAVALATKIQEAATIGEDYRKLVLDLHSLAMAEDDKLVVQAGEAAQEFLDSWKGQRKLKAYFGIDILDNFLFASDGSLTTLGARTSNGKTALAIQAALASAKHGIAVTYYSSEMTRGEIAARMIAQVGNVALEDLVRGRISLHREEIQRAQEILRDLPVYVVQTNRINEVIVDITKRFSAGKSQMAIVDFIQDFRGPGESEYTVISNFIRDLKGIAQRFNGIIIGTAQINRGTEFGGKSRPPRKSDLKGAGTFEETSDNVILLHRGVGEDGVLTNEASVIIDKQRNGRVGRLPLQFNPRRVVFEDPSAPFSYDKY